MSKVVVTYVRCDVCQDDTEGETIALTVDGTKGALDLCETHRKELFEPIMQAFKQYGVTRSTNLKASAKKKQLGPSSRELRDWARSNDYEVPDRGRVPQSIRDAWFAAQ